MLKYQKAQKINDNRKNEIRASMLRAHCIHPRVNADCDLRGEICDQDMRTIIKSDLDAKKRTEELAFYFPRIFGADTDTFNKSCDDLRKRAREIEYGK